MMGLQKDADYIKDIRSKIGHDCLITATAGVVVSSPEEKICLIFDRTHQRWCLPGGHMEIGDSWQSGAARELREETGLEVENSDLIPFASLSGKGYMSELPNKDLIAPFSLMFTCKAPANSSSLKVLDTKEVEKAMWIDLEAALQLDLRNSVRAMLEGYKKYLATNEFQSIILP